MNLKRHHVLYILLTICLIVALFVLLTPVTPNMSYTAPVTASSSAVTGQNASSTASTSATASTSNVNGIHFEVVSTTADQERGLGGRADVPPNYAMLFVFPADENVGFWMKDMLVPIDMLWLSDSGRILGIEDSVSPNSYPKAFYPPQPVKYVLEMRAGEARRQDWKVGTNVTLPAPFGLPNAH